MYLLNLLKPLIIYKKLKEALYYKTGENKDVQCTLCPHNCIIANGKRGVCGVRLNRDGKLISLVYGKPVAIHIDPIEKKPLYHFHPGSRIFSIGTYGCNLSCRFCQNYDISQEKDIGTLTNVKFISPDNIVELCLKNGLEFFAFTYNEPTIYYEYMFDTAKLCRKHNIKTVIVSNGQINEEPLRELINYIDAFNIDLKSFNPLFYKKYCNGEIEATKRTLGIIIENKKHLEITFLLIENLNDDENEFRQMCSYIKNSGGEIVFHISRAFPHYKMDFNPTPASLLKKFEKIAKEYFKYVYLGNI